ELASTAEGAERFIREARAANQIDHPNVIDVFAFGRLDDGRLYLVMDLVDGNSLRQRITDGPIDIAAALDILDQIAGAVDAAHARGVVHRDLKPDNIVLAGDKVLVLDFGIAKLLSSATDGSAPGTLTGRGTWLGTPGYMAPEQWSADGAGPASDRYALGVVAYELLSGKLPFAAPSLPAMMEQHFRAPVPALSTVRGAALASFDPILAKAMAKDPDARFASGRAMVDALRAATGTRRRSPASLHRAWIPASASVGVLGLSIVGVVMTRGGDDEPTPRAAPIANRIHVDVISEPLGAQVMRDGKLVGTTPATIDAAPGDRVGLDVRKAGYAPAHRDVVAGPSGQRVDVRLAAVDGFEGVWQLPSGELRAFRRIDDRVDVFKLAAISGPGEFFRTYELVLADTGIAFAGHEELVDPRAPGDPRCRVQLDVRYHYMPATDALELAREKVAIDIRDDHCVIAARELPAPQALVRVDRTRNDPRWSEAPAGTVDTARLAPKAVTAPSVKVDFKKRAADAQKLAAEKALAATRQRIQAPNAPNADVPPTQMVPPPQQAPPDPQLAPAQQAPAQPPRKGAKS
ncbi:MAG TPA: serine/threonine-protein kinase, partial [Kofleriaceae bacterium]|nr:serine/threonine-protein kinase [Kofleriaceae bacterium]